MMKITAHKIGDTFIRARLVSLGPGDWSAASNVYAQCSIVVQALTCTLTALPAADADGNTHSITVEATASETALWPVGNLMSDVVFTDASGTPEPVVRSTAPYAIKSSHKAADSVASGGPLALPGDLLPALRGPAGPTGAAGPAGPAGATGADGADGPSAYQVAVAAGFVGTEAAWLASLVGPQGPAGADGAVGAQGPAGPAGADALPADIAAIVNAAASKTTPVDADGVAGIDSEDGFGLKKFTWANIKATLKTYFDTLYAAASALTSHTGSTSNPHSVTAAQAGAIPAGGLKTVNGNGLEGSGDIAVSATPGGSTTQVQFNDGGAFGGDSGLTFDSTTKTLSAAGGIRTASGSTLTVSETWNNAAVAFPGAIVVDVTDTASDSGSLLVDLKVGGASRFKVNRAGDVRFSRGDYDSVYFLSEGSKYASLGFGVGGLVKMSVSNYYVSSNGVPFSAQWGGYFEIDADNGGTNVVRLYRDAANTLAQRNGANAQTFRVYGGYTDPGNGRWLEQSMTTAGVAVIKPTGIGTGASGNVLHISGLPTSNPGPGIIWNNGGSVAIGT